jgi:hypothetical protein
MSVATAYEDPELMAIKIKMTAGERRTKNVRFIKREVLALRAQRVSRSDTANIRAEVEARVEQRRARQRLRRPARKMTVRKTVAKAEAADKVEA